MYNTKIIESAKLIEQLIAIFTIFLNVTNMSHQNSTYIYKVYYTISL